MYGFWNDASYFYFFVEPISHDDVVSCDSGGGESTMMRPAASVWAWCTRTLDSIARPIAMACFSGNAERLDRAVMTAAEGMAFVHRPARLGAHTRSGGSSNRVQTPPAL
jgi:hypothetical protein